MSIILLIETSDEVCSVGLSKGDALIAEEKLIEKNAHSRVVNVLIEKLLQKTNHSFSDINAVAVSMGPGSYTGLRIGTATAKAFCYALNIPLIAINSLQSLAQVYINTNQISDDTLLMPMFDARRMEVYTALFDNFGNEVRSTSALILNKESLQEWIFEKRVLQFGNGSDKCVELIKEFEYAQIVQGIKPSVGGMVNMAYNKFSNKQFEDTAYFEPFYLKDFVTTTPKKNLV